MDVDIDMNMDTDMVNLVCQYIYRFYGIFLRKRQKDSSEVLMDLSLPRWEYFHYPSKQWRLLYPHEVVSHVTEVILKMAEDDLSLYTDRPDLLRMKEQLEKKDPVFLEKVINHWEHEFVPTS